jgi:hypothetical protein
MLFEIDTFHVVTPLDPYEGDRYNEPVDEYAQSSIIENVYKITRCMEDYTNPTTDGELSWRTVNLYVMDSKYFIERKQSKLYEVFVKI